MGHPVDKVEQKSSLFLNLFNLFSVKALQTISEGVENDYPFKTKIGTFNLALPN